MKIVRLVVSGHHDLAIDGLPLARRQSNHGDGPNNYSVYVSYWLVRDEPVQPDEDRAHAAAFGRRRDRVDLSEVPLREVEPFVPARDYSFASHLLSVERVRRIAPQLLPFLPPPRPAVPASDWIPAYPERWYQREIVEAIRDSATSYGDV